VAAWLQSETFDLSDGVLFTAEPGETGWLVTEQTELAAPDTLALAEEAGKPVVWCSLDTENGRMLCCVRNGVAELHTDNGTENSLPAVSGGKLFHYRDGILHAGDGALTVKVPGCAYTPLVEQGVEAVFYTVHEDGADVLYGQFLDGDWGKPVALYTAQQILHHTADVLPDGRLALSVSVVEDGTAAVLLLEGAPCCDLSLDTVSYDAESLADSELLIVRAAISNHGTESVGGVEVCVYDGASLVGRNYAAGLLCSGDSTAVRVECTLPAAVPESLQVQVRPLDGRDAVAADNEKTLTLRLTDLSMEQVRAEQTESSTVVLADVVNRGFLPVQHITVNLRRDKPDGEILQTQTVSQLETGASATVLFELDSCLPAGTVVYATAEPLQQENILGNNRILTTVAEAVKPELTLSGTVKDGGVEICVENTLGRSQTVIVAAAAYQNGKMLDVALTEQAAVADGANLSRLLPLKTEDADEIRLFLLDGDHVPLAEPVIPVSSF